ncbi:MAG: DUF2238 domain-containing protein [Planctomycetota bacterium]
MTQTSKTFDRQTLYVIAVASVSMLAAAPIAWGAGNGEFIFYILVMIGLGALVAWVHSRIHLHIASLWCLVAWVIAHLLGGLWVVPEGWPTMGDSGVLYTLWIVEGHLKYDHVVHAFGFGLTTWICWQGLSAIHPGVRPTLGALSLCATAGMGFGSLNEVVEFVATLIMPETGVGGYVNTGWDLVANAVGAVIAAVGIKVGWRDSI